MNRKILLPVIGFITVMFIVGQLQASDIVDVSALNDKIIVLHFDDGFVRYHQRGESRQNEWIVADPLDIIKAVTRTNYTIKSTSGFYSIPRNPEVITRKSKGTEYSWLCRNYVANMGCVNSVPDHASEHWIYLHLNEPLESGKTYTISTSNVAGNGSEWELEFTIEKNRTEAIHVNLVGYDPRAPKKYGYVYHWAGESGGIDFSRYRDNSFYLISTTTHSKEFTGKLKFRKAKSNKETYQTNDTPDQNFLGADVYECDFSNFNTPGEYILSVEGVGCSFPFTIKNDVLRLAYYNSIRGLYHNRLGIALEEPFTEFTRPAPHNPLITPGFAGKLKYSASRFIDWNDLDQSDSDKKAIEDGILGPINTWGWYQDAGDWDGYISHLKVPAMLMLSWEIAPEKFADGELNLPEGKNQIPDILDEARWLIRFFHRTRHEIMDKGYGTGGVGSRVAPDWFGHASDGTPSYLDTGQWIISGEDPFTTYFYAGLAAHYALVLNKLGVDDPEGIDWKSEAEQAFVWAKNNTKPDDTNLLKVHNFKISHFEMYAAATLFRLTGGEKYRNSVMQTGSNISSVSIIDEDQKWGSYALITGNENELGDDSFMAKIRGAVIATADQKYNSVEQRACRFGGNIYLPMLIGQGTTPRVFEIMMGHFLSKDYMPAKTTGYLAALYTTADYFLGCNPLNITYITHVGVRYPERVLHIDSWYNNKNEMIPGITPYGPWRDSGPGATGPWDIQWPYKTLFPVGIENWPGHERWFNNYTTPVNAEFTVHQNTILSAVVYGYLCDTPDGSFLPDKRPEIGITEPKQNEEVGGDVKIAVNVSDPDGTNDIAWVEFYNDWHKIGQSNKPPFQFSWKRPQYGSVKLSAKVVDKRGYSSKSDTVEFLVKPLNYKVKVIVKDSITGMLIKNGSVNINGQTELTDSAGIAGFDSVSGLMNIKMEHNRYFSKTVGPLSIYSDTILSFSLTPKKNEITMVVHDENSGIVFEGVPVVFNNQEEVTNSSGEVHFQAYSGNFNFWIEKKYFQEVSGLLEIYSDTVLHFYLQRTAAELKFVLTENSAPANKATVILNGDTLISTALGIARFKNLPLNQLFSYKIYKSGFQDITGTLFLTTDSIINITMEAYAVGINNDFLKNRLTIWPNPVNCNLNMATSFRIKNINLFTLSGSRKMLLYNQFSGLHNIDVSALESGAYLLKVIFSDGLCEVQKIIKTDSFAQ